jgi:hypothetical protein
MLTVRLIFAQARNSHRLEMCLFSRTQAYFATVLLDPMSDWCPIDCLTQEMQTKMLTVRVSGRKPTTVTEVLPEVPQCPKTNARTVR